ncbi:MAG: CtsR family transcriptional regulator [Firmicutes bacterium]|nr:CtsR family transcriptional regulator [Bacillota bacterium]
MASLTDHIENHLNKLLAISTRSYVEIQRAELARKFACAPSQVNYVLSSRFSLARGYLVESRRGGGGYIRIYRIASPQARNWAKTLSRMDAGSFDPVQARHFLKRICEEKALSQREAQVIKTLLQDKHYRGLDREDKINLQVKLFKATLEAVLRNSY